MFAAALLAFSAGCADSDPRPQDSPSPSELPAIILADGHVSPAEYEQAFLAYVTCLDDKGVPHGEPELNDQRLPAAWRISIGPFRQDLSDEVNQAVDDCDARHRREVEIAWQAQEGPSEEERQAQFDEVAACFSERSGLAAEDWNALSLMFRSQQLTNDQMRIHMGCMALVLEGDDSFFRGE